MTVQYNLFNHLTQAPDDPILALVARFKADPNPNKVDLSIGVYFDENGNTQNFEPVSQAQLAVAQKFYEINQNDLPPLRNSQTNLVNHDITVGYLPADGDCVYNQEIVKLVFGAKHELVTSGRVRAMETIAGTGGLRLAADFIKKHLGVTTAYMSNPTWGNHHAIFGGAGLQTSSYPYYNEATKSVAFDELCNFVKTLGSSDALVLHTCCHNPTGADLSKEQWQQLLAIIKEVNCVAVFDMAYQGFGKGLDEDAYAVRYASQVLDNYFVVSSCSKNFGVYGERLGALHVVTETAEYTNTAMSIIADIASNHYVCPSNNSAYLARTVLANPELKQQWENNLQAIRERIISTRSNFVNELKKYNLDFSFINNQVGMFSYTGLTKEQAQKLRSKYAIYLIDSGRINVLGLTEKNIPYVAQAIAQVLGQG